MAANVFGLFTHKEDVEHAIDDLKSEGYNPEEFSIVMKDSREAKEIHEDTGAGEGVAEGAVGGATTGAVVGALAGLVAAVAIPGLGAFFIGGPLAAALGLSGAAATTVSGAATGALAGGLVGALTGLGLSETEAEEYESRIQEGAILLAVPVLEGNHDFVKDIFEKFNASDIRVAEYREEDLRPRREHREDSHRPYFGFKGGRRDED